MSLYNLQVHQYKYTYMLCTHDIFVRTVHACHKTVLFIPYTLAFYIHTGFSVYVYTCLYRLAVCLTSLPLRSCTVLYIHTMRDNLATSAQER